MVNNAYTGGYWQSEPLSPSEFCNINAVGSVSGSRDVEIFDCGSEDAVVLIVSEALG